MSNVIALKHYNSDRRIIEILTGKDDISWTEDVGLESYAARYVDRAEWDRFAADYSDTVSEQTSRFVESRWGSERTERVLLEHDGRIVGGAAVVLFRVPGTDRGLAIVKWGPIWRQKGCDTDPGRLDHCLRALKQEYVDRRGCFLSVLPHADPDHGDAKVSALKGLGFTPGAVLPYPDRYLVNVSLDQEALRASLAQKWRYNLKKSMKNGLDVKFVSAEDGYPVFMELYDQMVGRKQFHDSSAIATLEDLMASPEEAHRPVFILAYHDGRPTAGAVVSVSGERAVYLYGATDQRALRLKAGYALHWWIAEWLCGLEDVRWYDLGGSDGDQGLHQFKKGFCGSAGAIVPTPPAFDCAGSGVVNLMGRAVYVARDLKAFASRVTHRAREKLAA